MNTINEITEGNHQESSIEIESRIIDYETNKKQLHHLLIHVENQLEEVEKFYRMLKKSFKDLSKNDYMGENLAELRSLIEIAQDHNRKHMEEK